jgi:hypothetical protein
MARASADPDSVSSMTWQRLCSILALCAISSIFGCGKTAAPTVHGKVTLDGESVSMGSIEFHPQGSGGTKASAAIEQGSYTIPATTKMQPGKYRVQINWMKPTGKKIPSADPGITADEMREAIPAKYNTNSTLTAEIAPGDSEKDFALTSK